MNFETRLSRDSIDETTIPEFIQADRRRRSPWVIVLALLLIAALAAGAYWYFNQKPDPKAAATSGSTTPAKPAKQLPRVTVVVPGLSQVANLVNASGTLAARRDMPVGVAGEGGMVTQVLVDQGQWVRAGQVLAVIDRQVQNQETGQLTAQMRVIETDIRLAQSELDRARALASRGFVSKADIDRKTAQRDGAQARLAVARAQLNQNQARMRRLDIRAPASGLILERKLEPGQVVSGGSGGLFRIAMNGEMEMHVAVSESDLVKLRTGNAVQVTPTGSTQAFWGRIWQVEPVIDPTTRMGTARVALAYNSALRPGGFASAKLQTGVINAPQLDESAVHSDPKGVNYVLALGPDNKVVRINVTVGSVSDGGKVSIMGGLTGQEKIVQSAGGFLQPGEEVIPTVAGAATPTPASEPAKT